MYGKGHIGMTQMLDVCCLCNDPLYDKTATDIFEVSADQKVLLYHFLVFYEKFYFFEYSKGGISVT